MSFRQRRSRLSITLSATAMSESLSAMVKELSSGTAVN
jgi:hypothetical protein